MDNYELGHFSLLEKIGEGGMGRVFKARDARLERLVAIKLLAEARLGDAGRRARFIQEAKAASALNHPNIITIHEVGEQNGQTFIVMELVAGKPLNELIPAKGMRLTEALRIAAQVADALTSAHAAGIVHRDLKPANIMVDPHGRVKVLDFGLAKLSTPSVAVTLEADEGTRTLVMEQPITEEGMIVGSVPYMSPEQADGKPVDARSDIFSFGAVLYEMITGQRAFRGESRVSTLAALMEKDPQPPSEISSNTPPDLERLIVRCLRKDVNRRSQSMADVKLALDELRDESESGKLVRPVEAAQSGVRRWLWPTVAIASLLIAAGALAWNYFRTGASQSKVPELVRVSPYDGHSYSHPAISPDGGFVAYISDRSGKNELWLQQVGGGDPIQLTHASESVAFPVFFPDGKRILYVTTSADNRKSTIQVISALGGDSRVLIQGGRIVNVCPILSPDGRQMAYFEDDARLMTVSSSGGKPRELSAWARMPAEYFGSAAWTPDGRYLLCLMTTSSPATNARKPEWFAFPVDGGNPVATGAGDALGAAGFGIGFPAVMVGDRVLFIYLRGRYLTGEIRLWPGSWQVHGVPRQLSFGTVAEIPSSSNSAGTVALEAGSDDVSDFFLVPVSHVTGQPTGVVRRLTKDRRYKFLLLKSGRPGYAYFRVPDDNFRSDSIYALNLDTGQQDLMAAGLPVLSVSAISPDGRRLVYSVPAGDSYSILLSDAGADSAETHEVCKGCGMALGFSPDGRFVMYDPTAKIKSDPKRKSTIRLLELANGKDSPWLEHPTDSVFLGNSLGQDSGWFQLSLNPPGSTGSARKFLVRWSESLVPESEWIKIPPETTVNSSRVSPTGNVFYHFEGSQLMAARFDSKAPGFSEPYPVKFVSGSAITPKPDDDWIVRGPGLVFSHIETGIPSVWLMKLR